MGMGDLLILAVAVTAAIGCGKWMEHLLGYRHGRVWSFAMTLLFFAVLLGTCFGLHWLLDRPVPGAFFEKGSYRVKVYVYASPDSKSVKRYRVPALVAREPEEGRSPYRVLSLFMPNGGVIHLEDSEMESDDPMQLSAFDAQERSWDILITSEVVR